MRLTTGRGSMSEGLTSHVTRPVPPDLRNGLPLNNNRNQNNRRRGRGNRNQGGGGNQGNRIDSRARGNAPQLLEKYKKLAQDAQHNGDRVQAEYYLQFADHYFRVIADNRSRQDDQRGDPRMNARRDEREQDDFDVETDGDDADNRYEARDRQPRERDNRDREPRRERPRREFTRDDRADEDSVREGSEGPSFEPEDNPFIREPQGDRPRRRAPRPRATEDRDAGIDAAALPPSFSANDSDEAAEAPAPRARRKRSDGGTLSAVG